MKCFNEYIKQYDMEDPDINYKYYHSYRVMENMEVLSRKLNMTEKDIHLAKVIGLLHDIGRFEQDKLFDSFKDTKMDHGDYGVIVLKETNLLDEVNIDKEDYEVVYKAIDNHNQFKINEGLTERELLYAKLIRDADKLDILYALGSNKYDVFKQGTGSISKEMEQDFLNGKPTNTRYIKSTNDSIVFYLCYVYDLNYKETYEILNKEKYYDKIYERFNNKEIFEPYIKQINNYIKERID